MCKVCGQEDWYCQHKPKYSFKQIKNEKTGYSLLSLDFQKRTIIKFNGEEEAFPESWDNMLIEEQISWLLERIK